MSSIPNELSVLEAAPLMCAGETTFSALRNSKARPGDLVAIQGIGGVKVILATAPNSKAI
ncbi:hypothetical protein [Halalkalibacter lacteus]|uniref:hypothetical protein n=1 Tax=Halalkalibacter lacteus TaxID=3090663 RepID=UPI002FC7BF96